MTIISQQIEQLEKSFKERFDKPLTFQADNQELKSMIRQYCKENGIGGVDNARI